ncbi:MAG: hypothetical protein U0556_10155 [Dehalococcoidia bacterium]
MRFGATRLRRMPLGPQALVRQVVELRVSPTAPVGPLPSRCCGTAQPQRIGAIDVVARPRSTAVPAFDHPSGATLGGFATLLGWSARSIGGEVEIELVWQAAATADRGGRCSRTLPGRTVGLSASMTARPPVAMRRPPPGCRAGW